MQINLNTQWARITYMYVIIISTENGKTALNTNTLW